MERAEAHGKTATGPRCTVLVKIGYAMGLTAPRIRNLRKKLGLSQRELGALTGASLSAVVVWETGKFRPQGEKKAALVALKRLRKREVRKLLAEKEGTKTGSGGNGVPAKRIYQEKGRRKMAAKPTGARRTKKGRGRS